VIVERDKVRECVERAFLLEPQAGLDAAIHATAQALALDVETVRECWEEQEQAA
jgi:hypothetical protein